MDRLFSIIKEAAYEVRLNLGPGYLESVYKNALLYELRQRGVNVKEEAPVPVFYKGICMGHFTADLIVNDCIIIELKAVRELAMAHELQLVNYLTATGIDFGFLINYGSDNYRIIQKTRLYKPRTPSTPS